MSGPPPADRPLASAADLDGLDFERAGGLVPVVSQHADTGEVLMLAYADREALERTLATGQLWLYSRSRQRLWHKGGTSGNVQRVLSLHADCDGDAVLALVRPAGPACHTGDRACFGRGAAPTLPALGDVLAERVGADPAGSYTARLLADRNLRLKKLGEEAAELVLACADGEDTIPDEAADLLYHALVACLAEGVAPAAVLAALGGRLPGRG